MKSLNDPCRRAGIVRCACLAAVECRAAERGDVGQHAFAGEAVEGAKPCTVMFLGLREAGSTKREQNEENSQTCDDNTGAKTVIR